MIRRGRCAPRRVACHLGQGFFRRDLRSAFHQWQNMAIQGNKPPPLPIHHRVPHRHGAAQKILEHRNHLPIPERRDHGLFRQLLPPARTVRKIEQVNPLVRGLAGGWFPPCLCLLKEHAGKEVPAGAFSSKVVQVQEGAGKLGVRDHNYWGRRGRR